MHIWVSNYLGFPRFTWTNLGRCYFLFIFTFLQILKTNVLETRYGGKVFCGVFWKLWIAFASDQKCLKICRFGRFCFYKEIYKIKTCSLLKKGLWQTFYIISNKNNFFRFNFEFLGDFFITARFSLVSNCLIKVRCDVRCDVSLTSVSK